MAYKKTKVSITDFIPYYGQVPIGKKDKNEEDLFVGDVVKYNKQDWIIGYRYGSFMLKQPHNMAMIGLANWSSVEKTSTVMGAEDYLIIGYENEDFIKEINLLQSE